ncbi:MAG: DUF4124 domain-containing protein [Enterobacterales bacterium]|nr:DUF4124 domain-containing protein [Enterobacterales bacterium]
MRFNLIITLLLALSVSAVQAKLVERIMYKWTDEKGQIHYTERAPKDIEYTVIRTHVETGSLSKKDTRVSDTNASIDQQDQAKSYKNWRSENCTIAQQNLEVLSNAKRIGVSDGQGGKRLMSDEEKAEKIAAMTKQKDKYCSAEAAKN